MSKRRTKRQPYMPPISWARFDAMRRALHWLYWKDQPLDKEMVLEVSDAIRKLHAIYQADLERSFSNKRAKKQDLRDAQLAMDLIHFFHVDAVTAMEAATGKRSRVSAASVRATLKNRSKKLYGDVYCPTPLEFEAAIERLRDGGHIER